MSEKFGVMIGRFNPIHLGHEGTLKTMIEECGENCLVLIGSANTPQSLRHFFSYSTRKYFVKKLFPLVNIAPLPDFPKNSDWYFAIDDLVGLMGQHAMECTFYCGCKEDVMILEQFTKNIRIVNRYDGTTTIVSATQVRDSLLHKRDLTGLVNPKIAQDMQEIFNDNWKEFEGR